MFHVSLYLKMKIKNRKTKILTPWCHAHSGVEFFIFCDRIYLGEIETEFENTLACLSGAQVGSNPEKNWRSKIS